MGRAIDTILAFATEGAAAAFPTALAATAGDSLQIRSFNDQKSAFVQSVIYSAGGGQLAQIKSPLMHDNVTGFTWQPGEVPSAFMLPPEYGIHLQPNDNISANGAIAAAGTITMGIVVYYEDVKGSEGQFVSWSDIKGIIKYTKSVEVQLNAIAVGAWTDTPLTATENQLHANKYYAVLGYGVDPAVDIVGIKGVATGNMRACGPGPVSTLDISSYYIYLSEKTGRPCIPVINANDRAAVYISAANHAAVAGQAAAVYPLMAELTREP